MKYKTRVIEVALIKAARQFPAIILTGPRQSGKTTLLKHLFEKNHRYVSLDGPNVRLQAQNDPALFLQNFPPPILIDEIQYAPQLFPHIKIWIDQHRDKKAQFILTGSQSFSLMANVTESLAGRTAVFHLLSFSLQERRKPRESLSLAALKKEVLRGGYPEIYSNKKGSLELWFSGYLQTYLERDVRQLKQIDDLGDFQRFIQLLASLNGQIMNLSGIASDMGVAVNTIKSWITVLEASGIVFLLRPFYMNRGKRIIKSPRIYFLDTGFLCYLSGITSEKQIFAGPSSGRLLETLILNEIVRTFHNRGLPPKVYFWRTSNGDEVDFIIETKDKIIPLEIKLSALFRKQMIIPLQFFMKIFADKVKEGYLISMAEETLKLDKRILALPLERWLQSNRF